MDDIYGQLNELREEIMNKVMTNQDLLKFLFYCDTKDVLSQPNLNRIQKDSLKLNQIFKYKRMPLNNETKTKCFLSMQFGRVVRNLENNHWVIPLFAFTIVCPNAISETLHGSRILAIEQCLEDSFSYQYIDKLGMMYIVGSDPETVDTGYQSRTMTFKTINWVE